MNQEQRQELIRLLQQDEDISPNWAPVIFPPEKREYELVYHGKEREEDIIANTLAVPLQKVRTFGKNGTDWQNKLVFGDNLQVMKSLVELKKKGPALQCGWHPVWSERDFRSGHRRHADRQRQWHGQRRGAHAGEHDLD